MYFRYCVFVFVCLWVLQYCVFFIFCLCCNYFSSSCSEMFSNSKFSDFYLFSPTVNALVNASVFQCLPLNLLVWKLDTPSESPECCESHRLYQIRMPQLFVEIFATIIIRQHQQRRKCNLDSTLVSRSVGRSFEFEAFKPVYIRQKTCHHVIMSSCHHVILSSFHTVILSSYIQFLLFADILLQIMCIFAVFSATTMICYALKITTWPHQYFCSKFQHRTR